eukprot:gene26188-32724_t
MYRTGTGQVYATAHPVHLDPENPQRKMIGAGAPLSKANLATFARAVDAATAFDGFVPENLLYTSANMIAWWVPASIRRSWFKANARAAEMGERSGDVAHPALVFVVVPGDWYVFALRDSARPGPGTHLQHAPHFNVWDGGRICTGSVTLPPAIEADAIRDYETAFFRSRFTHPNRADAVKYRGGATALWIDQLNKPDMPAMVRALRPAKETLRQAIERITARHNKSQ